MQLELFLLEASSGVLWEKLGDQLFTIIVLGYVAWLLWKRQQKLEDKLNGYLKEDRERMMNVISKNTDAFERLEDFIEKTVNKNH